MADEEEPEQEREPRLGDRYERTGGGTVVVVLVARLEGTNIKFIVYMNESTGEKLTRPLTSWDRSAHGAKKYQYIGNAEDLED